MTREEDVVPILRVAHAEQAIKWYEQLGFRQQGEIHRFEPGLPAFATVARGPVHLFLSEHEGDATPNTLVYLWVNDVDEIAQKFGRTPDDMPWARDIEITDPDGNRIRVGTAKEL